MGITIMQPESVSDAQDTTKRWMRGFINSATKHDDIISGVNMLGCDSIADRLVYLYGLPVDGPDEKPIVFGSLQTFALFVVEYTEILHPQISISPDGFVNAQWDIAGGNIIAMEFLPSNDIRFVRPRRSSEPKSQKSITGTLPLYDTEGIKRLVRQLNPNEPDNT